MDHEYANRVLGSNREFQELRNRFNSLGIFRLVIYIGATIFAIVAGSNQAWGLLIGGLIVSFILVMIVDYNRSAIRARQQGIAIRLGLITEEDLR